MVRTERFLADRQRALVEPLRLAVLALLPINEGQVVEGVGHVEVVRTERCFADRQRALEESRSLRVLPLVLIHER